MQPHNVVRELYQEASQIREPYSSLSEEERQWAAGLLARYEELEAEHGSLPGCTLLRPMLLSKNGRHEESLALAKQGYEQSPDWHGAVAVANAAQRAGDVELAAEMFTKGTEHDPNDVTCWLEVGDIRLEQGRFEEALDAYEEALDRDATHQWALPSAFFCRHSLGMEGNWLASLREVANQEGCTCGLEGCLTTLFGGYGASRGIARAEYLLSKLGEEPALQE